MGALASVINQLQGTNITIQSVLGKKHQEALDCLPLRTMKSLLEELEGEVEHKVSSLTSQGPASLALSGITFLDIRGIKTVARKG